MFVTSITLLDEYILFHKLIKKIEFSLALIII